MWFLFGFITLLSFSIYYSFKRRSAGWKGSLFPFSNLNFPYQYQFKKNEYKLFGFIVGIDAAQRYDYAFKKESYIDRLFKFVGVSVEHQTGDKSFDDLVYVISDNSHFHRQLSSNKKIINTVTDIFKIVERYKCKLKTLRHSNGRIWVHCKVPKSSEESDFYDMFDELVLLLQVIAEEVKKEPLSSLSSWKDPFVLKATLILAVSTGMAITGGVQVFRLTLTTLPFTIDEAKLFYDSLLYGASITVILVFIALFSLGRSARVHLVLIELLLVSSFGAVSIAFCNARESNMELDTSPAVTIEANLVDKEYSRGRRRRIAHYYLHIEGWNEKTTRVSIPSALYNSLNIGDKLDITEREGHFKYKWIESITKSDE